MPAQQTIGLSSSSGTSAHALMSATMAAGASAGVHRIEIRQVATAHRIAGAGFGDRVAALGYAGTFALGVAGGPSTYIAVRSEMSMADIGSA
ncbi:MAG: flagellar hook protein FliD, partial [Alphaproteobacteria bacterium]|nr:flagellar hook protein FliD [Alphaproteobacteria bacterium]